MSFEATVTPGETFPSGTPIDNAAFRRGAQPTVSIAGTVDADDLVPDAYFFGNATLSGSAISFSANGMPNPPPLSYSTGMMFCFLPNFNCPSGGVTVNINAIGAQNLYKDVNLPLQENDFLNGELVWIQFDGTNFQLLDNGLTVGAATAGVKVSIAASSTAAAMTAVTMVVSAPAGGPLYALSSVAVSVNIDNSGAGGLDTGSVGGASWYHLWVIWNGTTVAGVFSLSATTPTLPMGYFAQGYVCPAYWNGSNFTAQTIYGRECWCGNQTALSATAIGTSYGSGISLAAIVPPNALTVIGAAGVTTGYTTGNEGLNCLIVVSANTAGVGAQYCGGTLPSTTSPSLLDSFAVATSFKVPLLTAQTIYCKGIVPGTLGLIVINGYTF